MRYILNGLFSGLYIEIKHCPIKNVAEIQQRNSRLKQVTVYLMHFSVRFNFYLN